MRTDDRAATDPGLHVRRFVLVHSPLLGPFSWGAVADVLREGGDEVVVPDLSATLGEGPSYFSRQVAILRQELASPATVILAGHSGAGSLLLAAGSGSEGAAAYLFVDAALPHPGLAWMESVPAELADTVRQMAGPDGWLDSWATWWPEETLDSLLPDRDVREGFIARCPRLPLRMFEEVHTGVDATSETPAGYLRLSEAYDEEAAHCRAMGWSVEWRDYHHLALLTHPGEVAAAMRTLADALTGRAASSS